MILIIFSGVHIVFKERQISRGPSIIPEVGLKDRGSKTANYAVIKNTDMPAVLIEHGFFTNETEIELLKSSEWRQKAAQCDANGIMNFLYSFK